MPRGWWREAERGTPRRPSTRPCPELRRQRLRRLVRYLQALGRLEKLAAERAHPDDVERAYAAGGWKSRRGGAGGRGEAGGTAARAPARDEGQDRLAAAGGDGTDPATRGRHGGTGAGDQAADEDAPGAQARHHPGPQADGGSSRAATRPGRRDPEACAGEHDRDDDSTGPPGPGRETSSQPPAAGSAPAPSARPAPVEHKATPAGPPAAAPVPAPAGRYSVGAAELTKFLRHKAGIECCWSKADHDITEWTKHEGTRGRWERVGEMRRKMAARGRAGPRRFDPAELSIGRRAPGPSRLCHGWTPGDLAWEAAQEEAWLKNSWLWRREGCGRRVHKL